MKKFIIALLICLALAMGITAVGCSECKHEYDQGKTTRYATCTVEGEIQYKCVKCGDIKTESIATTSHYMQNEYTIEENVHYKKCKNCDYKENEQEHGYSNEYYYDDENHWKECLTCGKTIGKQEHSSVEACVCGYESATQGLEFTIMLGAESYAVSGVGTAIGGKIVIPYTYKGMPVTRINDFAFRNNKNVTSVRIPRNVTTIGENAFENCENLQTVTIDSASKLVNIGSASFLHCTKLQGFTIPKGVQTVGYSVFYGCSNLEQVEFEDGSLLTAITHQMFGECDKLKSITIPNLINSIKESAFFDCDALETVAFSSKDNLKILENNAFYGCEKLNSIEIVKSVTQIGAKVFYGCEGLKTINFNAIECMDLLYDAGAFDGVGTSTLEQTKVIIGQDVSKIPAYLFYTVDGNTRAKIDILDLTNNKVCVKIGKYSFSGVHSLSAVNFAVNNAVIEIGNYAFAETGLNEIVLPNGLTSIGTGAFEDCDEIKSITISDTVFSIGIYAFAGCEKLESITINDQASLKTIGAYAFFDCASLLRFAITSNVDSIGANAFANCITLSSVDFKVKDGWTAGSEKILASNLNSLETSAKYLTDDYYHVQWNK